MSFNKITKRNRDIYLSFGDFSFSEEKHLYCLSNDTVFMAYMFLRHYGAWRNRFSQDLSAVHPLVVDDTQWGMIQGAYENALYELRSRMCEDLVKTQRMILAALTGEAVDLESDLPATFSPSGMTPILDTRLEALRSQAQSGENTQHGDMGNVNTRLAEIAARLQTIADDATSEDLNFLIDDVSQAIGDVVTVIDGQDTQDELTTLAEKIDTLADRISPDGLSVQKTLHTGMIDAQGTAYLSSLVTEIRAGNITLGNVVTALSPLSDLGELVECCKANAVLREDPVLSTDIVVVTCPEKCANAAIIVGQSTDFLFKVREAIDNLAVKAAGFITAILIGAEIIPLTVGALVVSASTVTVIVDAIAKTFLAGEFGQLVTTWNIHKTSLHQALYEATSEATARAAVHTAIENWGMSIAQEETAKFIADGLYYNGLFGNDYWYEWLERGYFRHFEELGDWYNGDCSELANCNGGGGGGAHFAPCIDQDGRITPVNGVYNATFTNDRWEVDLVMDGAYSFSGTIDRQEQVEAWVLCYRCDEYQCSENSIGNLYDDIPYSTGAHILIHCSVEFSVDLVFVESEDNCGA